MIRTVHKPDEVLGASAIRAQHSRLLLNLLWCERSISRADLSRRTGLSRSTVSAIISDLLETGLVREARAGLSTGGRRPILLEFSDAASNIVGIELGATHVSVVLTDLRANVAQYRSVPVPVRDAPQEALSAMKRLVLEVCLANGTQPSSLVGVGVAVPSPLNPAEPGKLLPSVIPKWADIDLIEELEARIGAPVVLDNDANLGALAERWWGAGRTVSDLAYIKVATGIGAGLIMNGEIFRGSGGAAGEIGHTSIDANGPLCSCGLRGCLTTLVGSAALLERAQQEYRALGEDESPKTIDALVDDALAGERAAVAVIAYAGRQLGIGVANMLNLLNPRMVVLGGGLMRVGDLLLEPLRDTVSRLSLADSIAHAEILRSELDDQGIAVGAATLVLRSALENPEMFSRVVAAVGST